MPERLRLRRAGRLSRNVLFNTHATLCTATLVALKSLSYRLLQETLRHLVSLNIATFSQCLSYIFATPVFTHQFESACLLICASNYTHTIGFVVYVEDGTLGVTDG